MKTSDKFFLLTTSASVAFCIFLQFLLCHKVVVMTLDFNRGVPSPLFLHLSSGRWGVEQEKISLGNLLHLKIPWIISSRWIQGAVPVPLAVPWHLETQQSWHADCVTLQLWRCHEAECTDGQVGTSCGMSPLVHRGDTPGWTRRIRYLGTCREGL